MDGQVLVSIWRPESIPFFPTAAKSFQTGGEAIFLSGRFPNFRQHSLGQRRRQGAKAYVLH